MEIDSKDRRRISYLRFLTLVCIIIAAGGLSYASYYTVAYFESRLQNEEFSSLAKQLEATTLKSMHRKVCALRSLSEIFSFSCADPNIWPNCSFPIIPFFNITDPLIEMTELRTLAFAPIVAPDQVPQFEKFAYDTYESNGFPSMGISSFGRGIYSVNTTHGGRYRDTQGPSLNNQYQLLTPVHLAGNLEENRAAIMFNLYSEEFRISAIDFMINCFLAGGRHDECVSITDIIHLVQDPLFRPAVLILYPIAANLDPDKLVGLDYAVLNWDSILSNTLPEFVNGILVVLSGGKTTYTFRISHGQALLLGSGDLHERRYADHKVTFHIPNFAGSVVYTLTIYQSEEYVERFQTMLPIYALLIAIGIVILTSTIFLVYDYKMKREARELEVVMNTKRLFVRFISHEIRTPMNIVHLGLKLLAKEITILASELDANGSAAVQGIISQLNNWVGLTTEIEESSDAAILVLNDLINYDKISLGGMVIENDPLDLWTLVSTTFRPFMVQARERKITLRLYSQADDKNMGLEEREELWGLKFIGDPIKIVQVIRNLLSNALKFTPENGSVDVTAVYVENGLPGVSMGDIENKFSFTKCGSVVITVKDTGHGMSKEDQLKLFQEGIQFNANQLQAGGGSGLGLWISKGVVELHKGTLSGHSDGDGQGSTFQMELPVGHCSNSINDANEMELVKADEVIGAPGDISPNSVLTLTDRANFEGASNYGSQIHTILSVDDSPASRKICCRMLRHSGYICYEACDGMDCLNKYKSLSDEGITIDVILMDFEMPIMNGPTATSALIKMGCGCPIIGVTGNVLPEDRDTFLKSGAVDVLAKPLSIELLEKIFHRIRRVVTATPPSSSRCDIRLPQRLDNDVCPLELENQVIVEMV